MTVRVVGAGLGRTGTHSLKIALERLLGGTCHHMIEVFGHPEEMPVWQAAAEGHTPDWREFLAGYSATCDWPSAAFWPEISAAFPDALIVLSVRDPDSWWKSAHNTIFFPLNDALAKPVGEDPWADMIRAIFAARFTGDIDDERAMKDAFAAWNERVRREADASRLVEWQASDGWGPLCAALGVPVPDEPFPVTNTTAEFREMLGQPPL
jgi:Sulfotransferase domain